ncbi:hypothetical protein EMIHUDRAFT_236330 [Emiliania huxleyi CCMP1516]|uniref:Uncharacterized protein n=2 Tax=Emiliania huxleyi TaxID=2903 RepID=A0A0D3JTR9_EMIH1|nr:hypothetical protein EMIHUDRAFT_236330 [Emiliania huxleyi CCMP1516]EOD26904.1 hypothetical protein EMIHUDRAFT_236330 [Emiliania huxleyi CCMP1516]|eukprot:XP_005779333.1 hypothetical protein EMIHUDRAFT_236330 [Emiliania huxleyi CCMP1516]
MSLLSAAHVATAGVAELGLRRTSAPPRGAATAQFGDRSDFPPSLLSRFEEYEAALAAQARATAIGAANFIFGTSAVATASSLFLGRELAAARRKDEMGIYRTRYERFGRVRYDKRVDCPLEVDTGLLWVACSEEQALGCFLDNSALGPVGIETEVSRYIGRSRHGHRL